MSPRLWNSYLVALVCGGILLLLPQAATALVEDYQPTPLTYVVYTATCCGLVFLVVITLILRAYRWLHYALLVAALVLTHAANSGALPYLLGGSDFVLWVVPYLVISVTTAIGYWVAGAQIEAAHFLARYKKLFYFAAAGSLVGPLTSYFWLMKIPLNLMWIPQLILFYAMYIALMFPPWSWSVESTAQKVMTRSFPVLIGLTFLLIAFFEEPGDSLTGDIAIRLLLFGNVLMFVYVWVLAIWLGISAQSARRRAEHAALEASRNKAQMQLALVNAERDYEVAMDVAESSRRQLATVSHDLKQPLASLRVAVDRFAGAQAQSDGSALRRAVDYVESLARAYGATDDGAELAELNRDPEAEDARHSVVEDVPLRLLLNSLAQMFSQQAEAQGVELELPPSAAVVRVPPLDAMRVLSNLISNALQHAQASKIELVEQVVDGAVHIEVADDGIGVDDEELRKLRLSGAKGDASAGDGLGLAIVDELCAAHDWDLRLSTAPGRGLIASLRLPLS